MMPPTRITVTTGYQEKIQPMIDTFFDETQKGLAKLLSIKGDEFKGDEFEIKSGEIAYGPGRISDDRVTFLSYKDQIIAMVTETRTETNQVRYTFFKDLRQVM